jgi:ribosomal protein S12
MSYYLIPDSVKIIEHLSVVYTRMPTYNQLAINTRKKRRYKDKRPDLRGCPQKKGICLISFKMTPRKPNSALRKVAFVRFRR